MVGTTNCVHRDSGAAFFYRNGTRHTTLRSAERCTNATNDAVPHSATMWFLFILLLQVSSTVCFVCRGDWYSSCIIVLTRSLQQAATALTNCNNVLHGTPSIQCRDKLLIQVHPQCT
jgi:hypothetical protein